MGLRHALPILGLAALAATADAKKKAKPSTPKVETTALIREAEISACELARMAIGCLLFYEFRPGIGLPEANSTATLKLTQLERQPCEAAGALETTLALAEEVRKLDTSRVKSDGDPGVTSSPSPRAPHADGFDLVKRMLALRDALKSSDIDATRLASMAADLLKLQREAMLRLHRCKPRLSGLIAAEPGF